MSASPEPAVSAPPPRPSRPGRKGRIAAAVVGVVLLALVVCDVAGWPFLRLPLQRALASALNREVVIDAPFEMHLRSQLRLSVGGLHIAAPEWSKQPHFVDARPIRLSLGYGALFGRRAHLGLLDVDALSVFAERRSDGQASWTLTRSKPEPEASGDAASKIPVIDLLVVRQGQVKVQDAIAQIDLDASLTTREGTSEAQGGAMQIRGKGTWRRNPVAFEIQSPGLLAVAAGNRVGELKAQIKAGATELSYDGSVDDITSWSSFDGNVRLSGKSLGDLSELPGVTLPSTPPYDLRGRVNRDGKLLKIDLDSARIGTSQLGGHFEYDQRPAVPKLSGKLTGKRLALFDLGPSFGAPPRSEQAAPAASLKAAGKPAAIAQAGIKAAPARRPTSVAAAGGGAGGKANASAAIAKPGTADASGAEASGAKSSPADAGARVLPTRDFDIPGLKAMNADVQVAIDEFWPNTTIIESIIPLKARLELNDGAFRIADLEGGLAGGTVIGTMGLDASRNEQLPAWDAKLRWVNVDLQRYLKLGQDKTIVVGRFTGDADITGQGRSVAAILGTVKGRVRTGVLDGKLSHLVIEAAGLDIAQALGMLVRGDDMLPMTCAVFQFQASNGVLRTDTGLIDTSDTTFVLTGDVRLRDERLDLKLIQQPKDWSPLTLRSPITIGGSFSHPLVGIEPKPLAVKGVAAVALALVNPFAAVVPFFDFGSAQQPPQRCQQVIDSLQTRARRFDQQADASPGRETARSARPRTPVRSQP